MTHEDTATDHSVLANKGQSRSPRPLGGLALLALAGTLLLGLSACTVDDSIIENKLCDLNTPNKDRECVKGYEPHQESDGKCYCRPMKQSGLRKAPHTLRKTPHTKTQETISFDGVSRHIIGAPRPGDEGDPSLRLLRRLGVVTP